MNDALVVRRRQTGADVARQHQRLLGGQSADAAQQRGEILTIDELHRDEELPVDLGDVVQAADIRMRDLSADAHFFVKARGVAVMREKLQRDALTEFEIVGAVDLAHPALSDQRHDAVTLAEDRAGRELARCG